MATTRRELRRRIGGNMGERIDLVATATSGALNLFTDANNLVMADDELNGREAWYVSSNAAPSAANVATRRTVLYNDQSDTSIVVAPAWPGLPQTGDVVELYNARGFSATIVEIHDKINELIDEVSAEGALAEASGSYAFNRLSPTLACPDGWIWLFGAEHDDIYGNWHQIFPADLVVRPWDGLNGTVQLKNMAAVNSQLRNVRLIGAPQLAQLIQDVDSTTVDSSWLVDQATAELRRSISLRWGDAATALAISNIDLAEAEKRRPRAGGNFPNTGRRWSLPGNSA